MDSYICSAAVVEFCQNFDEYEAERDPNAPREYDRVMELSYGLTNEVGGSAAEVEFVSLVDNLAQSHKSEYECIRLEMQVQGDALRYSLKEWALVEMRNMELNSFVVANDLKANIYALGKLAGYSNSYSRGLCSQYLEDWKRARSKQDAEWEEWLSLIHI